MAPTKLRTSRQVGPIELTVLGIAWLSVAAMFGYVALATPMMATLLPSDRIAFGGSAVDLLAAALMATVPLSLATAGLARLFGAFRLAFEPRTDALHRVAGPLPVSGPVSRPAGRRNDSPRRPIQVTVFAATATEAWEIDGRSGCTVLRTDQIRPRAAGGRRQRPVPADRARQRQ
jgi:hypothetical protein